VRRNVKIFLIAAVLRQLDFDASEVRITWSVRPLDIGPLSNAGTVRGLTFADNYRPSRSHEFEPELAAILPCGSGDADHRVECRQTNPIV